MAAATRDDPYARRPGARRRIHRRLIFGHQVHERLARHLGAKGTLGRDAITYLQGRRIVYRDLRTDRVWSVGRPTSKPPLLAMFGRQLIVSAPEATGQYAIYVATP